MSYFRFLPLLLLAALLAGCSSSGSQREGHQYDPSDPSSFRTSGQEETAEKLYQDAKAAMRQGDFAGAATRFEDLQARYPFGAYFKQAQLDLINAYYRAGEMESSINAADRFMRLNPQDPGVAYALYMRARANLERGDDFLTRTFSIDRRIRDPGPIREAMRDLAQLIERFPDSDYTDDAQERVRTLRNHLAHYEMHVADFYMRRGAYVAAANRAKGVVADFQGTPAVRDALGVMVEAYGYLELDDLREDVLRVIRENFPDHPTLEQPQEEVPEPSLGMGN
ncbi:MAG: outer membrane protein assembly factor BamD [Aquisalimonadaceae bacterium]